jgi:hypothetical protein
MPKNKRSESHIDYPAQTRMLHKTKIYTILWAYDGEEENIIFIVNNPTIKFIQRITKTFRDRIKEKTSIEIPEKNAIFKNIQYNNPNYFLGCIQGKNKYDISLSMLAEITEGIFSKPADNLATIKALISRPTNTLTPALPDFTCLQSIHLFFKTCSQPTLGKYIRKNRSTQEIQSDIASIKKEIFTDGNVGFTQEKFKYQADREKFKNILRRRIKDLAIKKGIPKPDELITKFAPHTNTLTFIKPKNYTSQQFHTLLKEAEFFISPAEISQPMPEQKATPIPIPFSTSPLTFINTMTPKTPSTDSPTASSSSEISFSAEELPSTPLTEPAAPLKNLIVCDLFPGLEEVQEQEPASPTPCW